jgi:hypothetical protein
MCTWEIKFQLRRNSGSHLGEEFLYLLGYNGVIFQKAELFKFKLWKETFQV